MNKIYLICRIIRFTKYAKDIPETLKEMKDKQVRNSSELVSWRDYYAAAPSKVD